LPDADGRNSWTSTDVCGWLPGPDSKALVTS
jgi:hypothetical protein